MSRKEIIFVIIAVLQDGDAIIVHMPEIYLPQLCTPWCDNNFFENVPTQSGVYACQVQVKASSQMDNDYTVLQSVPIPLPIAFPA